MSGTVVVAFVVFIVLRKWDLIHIFDITYMSLCCWISVLIYYQFISLRLRATFIIHDRCITVLYFYYVSHDCITLRELWLRLIYFSLCLTWFIVLHFARIKTHFVTLSPLYVGFYALLDSITMSALSIRNFTNCSCVYMWNFWLFVITFLIQFSYDLPMV